MKYRLIGITGKAQVGKDTCADFIIQHLKYEKVSFAEPIKIMLAIGLGLTHEQLYGDQKETIDERYHCTPRYLMQTLGTEWGRDKIGEDIWTNAMKSHINDSNSNYIIPDVRFYDEAKFIRDNGILIHIKSNRKEIVGSSHKSESGIKKLPNDLILENNTTIDAYHDTISKLIAKKLY